MCILFLLCKFAQKLHLWCVELKQKCVEKLIYTSLLAKLTIMRTEKATCV